MGITNRELALIWNRKSIQERTEIVSDSTFEQVIKLLDSMNSDERMDVFAEYCTFCGDKNPICQCWNDE